MSENKEKKEFFEKKNSSNCFSGQIECSFEDPAGEVRTKHRKFFAQCPKMIERFFFQRNYFSLNDFFAHENAGSTISRNIFDKRPKVLCFVLIIRRPWEKIDFCQKKKHFFNKKKIYGKFELGSDNPAVKFSRLGWKIVTQCPILINKATTFLKNLFWIWKKSHGQVNGSFDDPPIFFPPEAENFWLTVRKFWTKSRKKFWLDVWRL